ncbi:protein dml-1 [Favolaschia claudopus]|uniref:Protein dml-1 n=1 Tax=Favolaschia claudopus TaxID=2862362 RepID=A0AAW0A7L8_9AGAR
MKEILYIQAGTQANYIGTHFWNTQESYFTYDEEEEEDPSSSGGHSTVNHSLSFREGLNQKNEPTFCPRLLAFDHKAQFNQANALFGMDGHADEQILWSEDPIEYKQQLVTKSRYQIDLEASDVDARHEASAVQLEDIRYWSDFNRVYYVPRTIQKVPDPPQWDGGASGGWNAGQDMFTRYNEETGLMEGPLRLFLEECDTIQGIQLMHDTMTFGSFVDALLTAVRDDFAKLPLLSWPLLSDTVPLKLTDNGLGVRKVINDALALRSMSEMSFMTVPIWSPATWTDEVCRNPYIQASTAHAYHTSAILSAHIESATLPLRLKSTTDDISSLSAQLSWKTAVPFAELSGVFPHASAPELDRRIYNFSSYTSISQSTLFSRRDVTRGFSPSDITSYDEWRNTFGFDETAASSTHAAAYPLPTSFPAFFSSPEAQAGSGPPEVLSRPRSTTVFSSLGATSGASGFFSGYARFLENGFRRRISVEKTGIELEELGDLVNDFWTIHDNVGGGGGDELDSDSDVHGEDEE